MLSGRHLLEKGDDVDVSLLEELVPPVLVLHLEEVAVVGLVPVEPGGALLVLSIRIRHGHGEHGLFVVRGQELLPIVGVVDEEVLLEELADHLLSRLVAEERLLRRRYVDLLLDVEDDRRRQVQSILR